MSPTNTAPLEIRGRPPSVKRFNRRVIGALLGSSALAILLAASFAFRSPDRSGDAPKVIYNTNSKVLPEVLNELPQKYDDVKPTRSRLGPPLPGDIGAGYYTGKVEPAAPDNPFRYQPPPRYSPALSQGYAGGTGQDANASSPRTSKLFFIANDGGDSGAGNANGIHAGEQRGNQGGNQSGLQGRLSNGFQDDLLNAAAPGEAALAALFGSGVFGAQGVGANRSTAEPQAQGQIQAQAPAVGNSDVYNPHSLQRPVSPYQVMAGTIIPASLITGLNSDLPGQVIGQVTENVFDTPTGQHLLIPQGTKLLGRYDSEIDAGQSRALVVWNRLVLPDGSSLEIDSLPGTDLSGETGLRDKVDRHRGSLFGAALLSSVLSVASELGSNDEDRILEAIRGGGQDTINQAGQSAVNQALSRKPTLRVRPGWRLRVIVNQDLVLKPYGG